jgi:hypothetical protein
MVCSHNQVGALYHVCGDQCGFRSRLNIPWQEHAATLILNLQHTGPIIF